MLATLIPLLIALVSYFGSKKMGASDSVALGVAGAAGLGSYYVATQTEWGRGAVGSLSAAFGLATDSQGQIMNADGTTPATIPDGAVPTKDADGNYVYDSNGELKYTFPVGAATSTVGGALDSLVKAGTTALPYVAGAVAAKSLFDQSWFLPAAFGLGAFFLLKD